MDATIYHNPKCSTSRKALQALRDAGIEPVLVDEPETITQERAFELLAEKRAKGPTTRKKSTTKKTTAKKATTKKAATKKTAAKKTASKQTAAGKTTAKNTSAAPSAAKKTTRKKA